MDPDEDPSSPSMSGKVTRKGLIVRTRYAELHNAVLTFYKDSKRKAIESQITITPTTKINEVVKGKKTRIILTDKDQKESFDVKDPEDVFKWLVALKGCLYANSNLSMSMFDIISVIGRGSNGKVMLVRKKDTQQLYALKTIRKDKLGDTKKLNMVIRERSVLVQMRHPFIVELKFAFQTLSKFYLGMDFIPGGELFYHMDRRGRFQLPEVRMFIAEIALAFDYLHSQNIIYRDLKPENVMLDEQGYVKLTDFGLAKILTAEHRVASTICGTVEYMAPEVVSRKPYSFAVDWWALGVLAFEVSFCRAPFSGDNMQKVFQKIVNDEPHFSKGTDPDLKEVILALMQKDPERRAKLKDLKQMKLFTDLDWDALLERRIPAPFVPEVTPGQASNVDSNFTRERAWDSFSSPVVGDDAHCSNFSWTNLEPSILVPPVEAEKSPLASNEVDNQPPSAESPLTM